MSIPDTTARRLVNLEHAIGAVMIYAERQNLRPDPMNLVALERVLSHFRIVSWPEQETIRRMFADIVPGG